MQPLWPIILLVGLAAPSVATQVDASSEGGMLADRSRPRDIGQFAKMDSTAQRRWIEGILARLDRANRLVLEPDEAARLRARSAVLLRQVSQGRLVTATEAEDLLRRTDQREKAAVEQLAHRFRADVYQTFRQRRGTFTRRRVAWNRVLADWEAAGSSFEEQDRLIEWLQAAIRVSQPDSVGPLPADPEFTIDRLAAEEIAAPGPTSPITPPQIMPPPIATPPIATPPPWPRSQDRNRLADAPPSLAQPDMASPEPQPLPPLASSTDSRRGTSDVPIPREIAPVARQPVTRPPVARQPTVVPSPSISVIAEEPPSPAVASASLPPRTTSVGVNVEELAARTAGVNLAVRALEAELGQHGPWNSDRLRPLVDQLGRLVDRRNDLAMYHRLVAEGKLADSQRLDSPDSLISQVAARIFEARNDAARFDFEGSESQRQAELRQLDELSRRLARVASRP